ELTGFLASYGGHVFSRVSVHVWPETLPCDEPVLHDVANAYGTAGLDAQELTCRVDTGVPSQPADIRCGIDAQHLEPFSLQILQEQSNVTPHFQHECLQSEVAPRR